MKEIKAFIRKRKSEEVVDALEAIGIDRMTLIDVMGVGSTDPNQSQFSVRIAERYAEFAKLVLVCKKEEVSQIVEVIREKAHTGIKGDGMIYVSDVEQAIHIRTGRTGRDALLSGDEPRTS
ncbi:P-II family nitrogen regulator [Aliifodinibius sp. S!AR15-10]|uniref:P-II family nitrogen regulator n=1 Tax=Aliifodinibius sp. S!AR15-10 TaxID=2950437 RepID=UPI0028570D9A|nr:P-II family nitrogen regulator [Aliifodinibius sp. S!AR15-10]MDR8390473.1 P-II family nitrogen regulator [Aliifodinibius sp. S!AR15-10]